MRKELLQLKSQRVQMKEKPCIGFTQETLIEFNVYLIYTWLIVHAILNLTYPKEYI